MAVPALAIVLAACSSDALTMPAASPPAQRGQSLAVSGGALDALRGTVSDARVRVLPGIGDAEVQSRLGSALSRVSDALTANDAEALAASLGLANHALNAEIEASGTDSPAAADFAALGLALSAVDEALPAHLRTQ
jgi:hypothetical protein